MPRWVKRMVACKYAGWGRTKMDGLISEGKIRANKEGEGGTNAPVHVDLDSIDEFYAAMQTAPGIPRKSKRKNTDDADTAAA